MKSITLILIFSFSLAHLPKGSTTIGGWGYYSKQTNLCDDCFTLSISPEINYFFTSYYSLDIDLDLIKTQDARYRLLDIGTSYYFYKSAYFKSSVILESYSNENQIDEFSGESVNTNKINGLRFGLGYARKISNRIFIDISYNLISQEDSYDSKYFSKRFLYSIKFIL